MREKEISEILVGETRTVTVRFPANLLDRIKAAAIKKTPGLARKERGAITEGLLYFAALGLLEWEAKEGTAREGDNFNPSKVEGPARGARAK